MKHHFLVWLDSLRLAFGPHGLPKPAKAHRAAADIRESLSMLKHYRRTISFDSTEPE